jgi:ribbon-helix-helix CopG family protein
MKKKLKPVSIDRIEGEVEEGKEVIDRYFDPASTVVRGPRKVHRIKKTNLDLTEAMAEELDRVAESLNVSRQAVIKVYLRQALDQHALAESLIRSEKERRVGKEGVRQS